MAPNVELRVNRRQFNDWTSVRITRSLTSIADSFTLQYVDTKPRLDYPIEEGDKCEVFIGNNRILTGHVEVATWAYNAGPVNGNPSHSFTVEGRSKTGDLVDSSVLEPKTWQKKTFLTIATELCKPFSILVKLSTNVDPLVLLPIKKHSAEPGDTVADVLGRLAEKLGVLLRTTPDGILEIGRPPKLIEKSGLTLGRSGRIKSGSRRSDSRERHDLYVAYGQRQGSALLTAEAAREGKQSATDRRVKRYRPLVFLQDGDSSDGTLTRAAEWVRNIRAGRGETVRYTVQGWESLPGQPWQLGATVIAIDPLLRIKRKALIIESTGFSYSGAGEECQIGLVMPEAFSSLTPPSAPKITDGVLTW